MCIKPRFTCSIITLGTAWNDRKKYKRVCAQSCNRILRSLLEECQSRWLAEAVDNALDALQIHDGAAHACYETVVFCIIYNANHNVLQAMA